MTDPPCRRRYRVLQRLIQDMDERIDGVIPSHLPGLREVFEDDVALVGALQMRWYTRLSGRIEVEQTQLSDRERAVVSAWRLTQTELPGVRRALDRAIESPSSPEMRLMLAKARRKEHIMVALMAGLTWFQDDRAAELGSDLELAARQESELQPRHTEARRRTLLARLRARLAA